LAWGWEHGRKVDSCSSLKQQQPGVDWGVEHSSSFPCTSFVVAAVLVGGLFRVSPEIMDVFLWWIDVIAA